MEEIAEERRIEGFGRDAKNVRDSDAVILIDVKRNKSFGLNCGVCSYKEFEEAQKRRGEDFIGPTCHVRP